MFEGTQNPLIIGQTFPTREILLLQGVEEANIYRAYITVCCSDSLQLEVRMGRDFYVNAGWGKKKELKMNQLTMPNSSREVPQQQDEAVASTAGKTDEDGRVDSDDCGIIGL
jgi:hypothetical protein